MERPGWVGFGSIWYGLGEAWRGFVRIGWAWKGGVWHGFYCLAGVATSATREDNMIPAEIEIPAGIRMETQRWYGWVPVVCKGETLCVDGQGPVFPNDEIRFVLLDSNTLAPTIKFQKKLEAMGFTNAYTCVYEQRRLYEAV